MHARGHGSFGRRRCRGSYDMTHSALEWRDWSPVKVLRCLFISGIPPRAPPNAAFSPHPSANRRFVFFMSSKRRGLHRVIAVMRVRLASVVTVSRHGEIDRRPRCKCSLLVVKTAAAPSGYKQLYNRGTREWWPDGRLAQPPSSKFHRRCGSPLERRS